MAATMRLGALAMVVALGVSGCSYAANEPGLLPSRRPAETAPADRPAFTPKPTNPALPVAGQQTWTTADGLDVTVRFAVHAVRRVDGATTLDWSITPIAAPNATFGDELPSQVDLGVTPATTGDIDVNLLDSAAGLAYPPLRNRSRRSFNHCLCTPPWLIQQRLRLGETRVMQTVFAELPATAGFIDVLLPNVAPFFHVPVTPIGEAPTAARPVDLARPAEATRPAAAARTVSSPAGRSRRVLSVQIDRVVAGTDLTAMEWTVRWTGDRQGTLTPWLGTIVGGEPEPGGGSMINASPTDGPRLHAGQAALRAPGVEYRQFGRTVYDCLCSDLGMWARGLARSGSPIQVVTIYPPLPAGTRQVDVELPGADTIRRVPITAAVDAAGQLGPTDRRTTGTWHYAVDDLPTGWSTEDWPTDVPESAQLPNYTGEPHRIVGISR